MRRRARRARFCVLDIRAWRGRLGSLDSAALLRLQLLQWRDVLSTLLPRGPTHAARRARGYGGPTPSWKQQWWSTSSPRFRGSARLLIGRQRVCGFPTRYSHAPATPPPVRLRPRLSVSQNTNVTFCDGSSPFHCWPWAVAWRRGPTRGQRPPSCWVLGVMPGCDSVTRMQTLSRIMGWLPWSASFKLEIRVSFFQIELRP